jgi:hypothetical protein
MSKDRKQGGIGNRNTVRSKVGLESTGVIAERNNEVISSFEFCFTAGHTCHKTIVKVISYIYWNFTKKVRWVFTESRVEEPLNCVASYTFLALIYKKFKLGLPNWMCLCSSKFFCTEIGLFLSTRGQCRNRRRGCWNFKKSAITEF